MITVALEPTPRRDLRLLSDLYMPGLAAVAYYLGAQAAFLVGTLSDKIFAPLWPPNVILFCALLLSDPRRWPLFVAACVPAHFIAEHGVGMPVAQAGIAFITNCAVAILNAIGIRWLVGDHRCFSNLRDASSYAVVTVFASPLIAASGGAFVRYTGTSGGDYIHDWAQWFASNALGAATLGPVLLIALTWRGHFSRIPLGRIIETGLVAAILIITASFAFGVTAKSVATGYLPAVLYLPVPLILWAAVRLGVGAASSATLLVGGILLWHSLNGPNLFTVSDPETNVLSLQIFLIGLTVPILLLSAAIEETRLAHVEARGNEARMALAAAASNVGLWVYNYASKHFWATEHLRVMFDLPDIVPLKPNALLARVHPADVQMATSAMQRVIRERAELDIQFRVLARDGSVRWIAAVARAPIDQDSYDEITGTFADITMRKNAEEDSARKQQEVTHLMRVSMLGELSAGIAHELTQPMTSILSNAQAGRMLMDAPEKDLDEVTSILDDIISEDTRAGDVLNRLRTLLRNGEVNVADVNVNDLIVSTLHLLHSEFLGRRVTVTQSLRPDLPAVKGDAVQLQQIVLNLLLNAMDAMDDLLPSERVVTIKTLLLEGAGIEIQIRDYGAGLAATQQQVFRPFFTTKKHGLGLGLSICASIAKAHGGSLSLEAGGGDGVTAKVRLPLKSIDLQ